MSGQDLFVIGILFMGLAVIAGLIIHFGGSLRYWKGHMDGYEKGYQECQEDAQQYFPWNADHEVLREWADIREVEQRLSSETEQFLETI